MRFTILTALASVAMYQFNSRAYLYLFLGEFDTSIYTRDLLVYCSVCSTILNFQNLYHHAFHHPHCSRLRWPFHGYLGIRGSIMELALNRI
jgi:hypothetical protein